MKMQDRMGTEVDYRNKKGEECTGTVTNYNLVNQDWIYEIYENIYIDWDEANQTYYQVD